MPSPSPSTPPPPPRSSLITRAKTAPSRRFWLFTGTLVGALGLLSVGTKLHKAFIASHAGGASPSGSSAPDLAALLSVISSDLRFLAMWGLSWGLLLHISRGRTRATWAALMQAATACLLLFVVIEHAFFIVTGTQLDWDLLVYSTIHADRLRKVVSSEISAAWWAAGAAVTLIAALPWLWRPRGTCPNMDNPAELRRTCSHLVQSRPRDRDDLAPATNAGRRTVVIIGSVCLLLAGVPFIWGDRALTARLQPLRRAPIVEHVKDAIHWALQPDRRDAAAAANGRPVAPLVVVRTARTKPLNIVLITLESVRARSLTPYNPDVHTTPHLNELARRGTLFEHAYTIVPHTTKSLIPLHCGIPPKLTPYFDEATKGGLPSDCLAKVLRRQGWRTHFIQTPESLFERRRDLVRAFGFSGLTSDENLPKKGFQRAGYFGYEDDVLLQPTFDWIDKQQKSHPKQPFFLGMLNVTTHHPYEIPSRYTPPTWPTDGPGKATGSLAKYYNTLSYVDRFLGKLFAGFDKRGMAKNTIFLIVGDHGEAFGEHGLFQHGHTMHEEGLHVPLLLIGPGIPAGVRRGGLRQHIDVMPTLLELVGLRVAAGDLPGRSLLTTDGHDRLYFSCWRKDSCRALRVGDLKIIHYFGKRDDEAYNLANDAMEQHDLVASGAVTKPAREKAVAELETWALGVNARYGNQAKRRRNPWVSKTRPKDVGTPTDIVFDGWVRLIGYSIEKTALRDGDATWVTAYLQVLMKPPPHGLIWLHAVGPKIRGKRKRRVADHVPVEGSYPVPEWQVGDFITDRHWLRMKPGHPSGKYELYFGFYDPSRNQRAQPKGTGAPLTTSNGVQLGVLNVTNRQTGPVPPRSSLQALTPAERARIWPLDGTDPNMANSAQLRGESFSKRAEPVCGGKAQLAGLGRARRAPKNEKETGPNARRTCSHLVQSPLDSPRAIPQPHGVTATFGDLVQLRGVGTTGATLQMKQKATWTVFLTLLRDMPRWTSPFVHITGPRPSTKRRRNIGVAPFGDRLPVHHWKKGWRMAVPLEIEMGDGFEPGIYDVWFGFWDPNVAKTNQRYPVVSSATVENDRLLIGHFELTKIMP